jgi:hypothetical protein
VAVLRIIPAGDLALVAGNFDVLGTTSSSRVRYIRQKISCRFKFFLREWFLDIRQGVPYYRDVFRKRPNLALIRALFLRVLRSTPGVLSVVRFALSYDPETRSATFAFQALVAGGEVVVRPEDEDFLVGLAPAA